MRFVAVVSFSNVEYKDAWSASRAATLASSELGVVSGEVEDFRLAVDPEPRLHRAAAYTAVSDVNQVSVSSDHSATF